MSSILIVLSAADTWIRSDGSEYATGFWAEELIVPLRRFLDAGHTVDFATPGGQAPTLDPHSVDPALSVTPPPCFAPKSTRSQTGWKRSSVPSVTGRQLC